MKSGDSNSEANLQKIGVTIKKLRQEKGFTSYEKFAIEYELDRKQYWRIENGSNLTLNTLIKILQIHQITFVQFFQMVES